MAWRAGLVIAAAVIGFAASSARAQFSYDVPFVPTPYVVVEEMLHMILAANVLNASWSKRCCGSRKSAPTIS